MVDKLVVTDESFLVGDPDFGLSILKRKNQCLKKGFKLHLSQQFKWVLWVSTTFPSPTKDFQKISEKQKGAMRRLSEKFVWKDQRRKGGAAWAVRLRNHKSFSHHLQTDQLCPTPTTNCDGFYYRGVFQSLCQQNIFYRCSDPLSHSQGIL